jgi:hypothetical protein
VFILFLFFVLGLFVREGRTLTGLCANQDTCFQSFTQRCSIACPVPFTLMLSALDLGLNAANVNPHSDLDAGYVDIHHPMPFNSNNSWEMPDL